MLKQLVSLGLLGVGACALSAMPSLKKHPLEVKFYHRNFAHRGLFDNRSRCENSLSAFRAAVEHGYGIELDLQMTADGEVVATIPIVAAQAVERLSVGGIFQRMLRSLFLAG